MRRWRRQRQPENLAQAQPFHLLFGRKGTACQQAVGRAVYHFQAA
ncbi:hypothetical protein [Kingella oralis]|nr:hypothetical protein [Kingella oralis]